MSQVRGRTPSRPRIAVTTGEPAGIGPEISIQAASKFASRENIELVLIGDRALLDERARSADTALPSNVTVRSIELAQRVTPGHLDARNARYVLATLDAAIDGCLGGSFDAMVTAPVQKSTINEGAVAFAGHTEYLAQRSGVPHVVMLLVGMTELGPLRVALATTHVALSEVPTAINARNLRTTLQILDADLRRRFGIARPRIAVTGLNPHAGEGGYLGREEIDVIAPLIAEMNSEGFLIEGPLPADTVFVPSVVQRFDTVLTMYHDQGLPVLKYATFGHGVNVTLGLPFIRTSVDHGTALDLAGSGRADAGSLEAAINLAVELAARN